MAPLTVLDLRDLAPGEVQRRLENLREAKTHQRMRVEDGQVLDIVAVRLPGGRARMCLDVDMLAADAMSYRVLVSDLARRYRGETLAPIDYTFARYLLRTAPDGGAERDRDRAWWRERLDDLPTAPVLPVRTRPAEQRRTVRHHHRLEPEAKARLLAAAHERGVTPAMALASVFAEVIGRWSAEPRFLLNLPAVPSGSGASTDRSGGRGLHLVGAARCRRAHPGQRARPGADAAADAAHQRRAQRLRRPGGAARPR